jgi:hypothetical protein
LWEKFFQSNHLEDLDGAGVRIKMEFEDRMGRDQWGKLSLDARIIFN